MALYGTACFHYKRAHLDLSSIFFEAITLTTSLNPIRDNPWQSVIEFFEKDMVRSVAFVIDYDFDLISISLCSVANDGIYGAKRLPRDTKMDQY